MIIPETIATHHDLIVMHKPPMVVQENQKILFTNENLIVLSN